jgi:hypothetical protein
MNGKSQIRQQIDARKAAKRASHFEYDGIAYDFRRYPLLYIGLIISGFLSMCAGVFIGLAPHYQNGLLVAETGPLNVFFAILYAVTFPIFGEYGIFQWHKKAILRDEGGPKEGNQAQWWISYGMLCATVVFTLVTSVAAAIIVASLFQSFDVFAVIPAWAQTWAVLIIPFGAVLHAVSSLAYKHFSAEAEEEREIERQLQQTVSDAKHRVGTARATAQTDLILAQTKAYEDQARQEAPQIGRARGRQQWETDRERFGGGLVERPSFSESLLPTPHIAKFPMPTLPEGNDESLAGENPPNP